MRIKKTFFYIAFFLFLINTFFGILGFTYSFHYIKNINIIIGDMDNNGKRDVKVTAINTTKCSIDNTEWKDANDCMYNLPNGKYTIFLKNDYETIKKEFEVINTPIGNFYTNIDMLDTYYLAKGGNKEIIYEFDYPEEFNTNVIYEIMDESIIKMDGNKIIGLENGSTKLRITLNDTNSKEFNIVVTDLISPPLLDNSKSYLPCGRYSEEEAELLDKILASRVKEAGQGTRGGVLAAARFITLEFPYIIKYFNENGRLKEHGLKRHIDAEGRYYHVGLYLSTSKYADLEPGASTKTGPSIWGCKLYDSFLGEMRPNGFTCSGFVTWAMLNGGFDVGDVGAGNFAHLNDDLYDLGPHNKITYDYMKNGNYKVGDFIARDGHAALIIGISDTTIYTAESLPPKLKVYTYERYSGIVRDTNLTYIIEMSDIYPNGDGIYTDMW